MRRYGIIATIAFVLAFSSSIQQKCLADGSAESHYKQGIKYSVSGAIDAALSEYKKAIQVDPYLAKAYNNLGYIYRMKGKKDLAIEYYEKALELNPKDDTAHTNLASVYDSMGNYDKAIDEFHKALDLDPGSITVELSLEKVLKKKAQAEGKTFDQVEAEVAALYPEKETEPSYNQYLDLINEDQEAEDCSDTVQYEKEVSTQTEEVKESTEKILDPIYQYEEKPETPAVEQSYDSKTIDIQNYIEEGLDEQPPTSIEQSSDNAEKKEVNKIKALLKDPNVGALMVLYKQ